MGNQSIMHEKEQGDNDDDDDDGGDDSQWDENEDLQLSFDLSYGNFSFQVSLNETPLKSVENLSKSTSKFRHSSHSTPIQPLRLTGDDNDNERPVFDLDASFDSPLPLKERLKRGLL